MEGQSLSSSFFNSFQSTDKPLNMLSKHIIAQLVTSFLLIGDAVVASALPPSPPGQVHTQRDDTAPNRDVLQTDTVEDGLITWYGNATQEALIAEALASNQSLSTLSFLRNDPSINPESHLLKRQCPTNGITCKFDQFASSLICERLLGYINDHGNTLLPYFPHAVCQTDRIYTYHKCCVSWTNPVLGYLSNIQLPMFLTYQHCNSRISGQVAGIAKGVVLGGICQNVCTSINEAPSWCSSG